MFRKIFIKFDVFPAFLCYFLLLQKIRKCLGIAGEMLENVGKFFFVCSESLKQICQLLFEKILPSKRITIIEILEIT